MRVDGNCNAGFDLSLPAGQFEHSCDNIRVCTKDLDCMFDAAREKLGDGIGELCKRIDPRNPLGSESNLELDVDIGAGAATNSTRRGVVRDDSFDSLCTRS